MLSKLVLLTLLPLTTYADELTCIKNGKIRTVSQTESRIQNSSYCSNADGTVLIEEKCYRSDCLRNLQPINFHLKNNLTDGWGSPGFAHCRQQGGSPELIEFMWQKKWLSLDRCLIKKPIPTFVDTGYFYKINRMKLNK